MGVFVGGIGVAVGMAAMVCVTASHACAAAVPATSTGFAVGVAGAPHAAKARVTKIEIVSRNLFFIRSPSLYFYHKKVVSYRDHF
jgi:hypothetical protein